MAFFPPLHNAFSFAVCSEYKESSSCHSVDYTNAGSVCVGQKEPENGVVCTAVIHKHDCHGLMSS